MMLKTSVEILQCPIFISHARTHRGHLLAIKDVRVRAAAGSAGRWRQRLNDVWCPGAPQKGPGERINRLVERGRVAARL
jgi:hypothetical protein